MALDLSLEGPTAVYQETKAGKEFRAVDTMCSMARRYKRHAAGGD